MSQFAKTLLTLCALLVITVPALAQKDGRTGRGGAGYFGAGITYLTDIGDLNDDLDAAGYPESNRIGINIGGGGYGILRSGLMLGGEGYGVIVSNESSTAREVNYAAGFGFFNLGYQAYNRDGQLVAYPLLGVGGGGSTLAFEYTDAETFDDVLSDPDRGANLVKAALLLQLGGGVELRGSRASVQGGPFIGLRAGYMFSPIAGDWTFDEGDEIRGGPDASPGGFYIRLIVGGGGPQKVAR